jgi:ferritin-like protein
MASEKLHEIIDALSPAVIDGHRATVSLMEELEAVDWYNQRAAATDDDELREILEHNRDEEKEHAAMLLEWLRRRDPALDAHFRTYLFTQGSLTGIEDEDGAAADDARNETATVADASLGLGSLKGVPQQ